MAERSGKREGKWAGKQIFTTGEAAEVCKVSQQTIIRCFDSGRLQGFRVPGSRFRRIPRGELIRFMRANDIPIDPLGGAERKVLLVDDDPAILTLVQELLKRDDRYEVRTASSGFEAGLVTEEFRPNLVLLDYLLPDLNGTVVCERIRARPEFAGMRIVFVSAAATDAEVQDLLRQGADGFIRKPFAPDEIVRRIEAMFAA
jgi:excisionase family DNA binding protein